MDNATVDNRLVPHVDACDRCAHPPEAHPGRGRLLLRVAEPRELSVLDAADILDLTANQIWALLHAGTLRAVRLPGGGWRVRVSDLERFLTNDR